MIGVKLVRKYLTTGFLFPVIFLSLVLSGCSYYTLKMVDAEKFITREKKIRKDVKHDTDPFNKPVFKFKRIYIHEENGTIRECKNLLIVDTQLYFTMSDKELNINLRDTIVRPDQFRYAKSLHIDLNDSVNLQSGENFITSSDIEQMSYYWKINPREAGDDGRYSGAQIFLYLILGFGILIALVAVVVAAAKTAANDMFGTACYVATMAYGDVNAPQVELLRKYRDEKLRHHFFGMLFIRFYYTVSPSLVFLLKDAGSVHRFIRRLLDRYVHYLCKKYAW